MGTLLQLSSLALRPLVATAIQAVGVPAGDAAAQAVSGFLQQRFSDQSQRLTRALHQASERAWHSLEIALAGESWWSAVKVTLAPADEKAFRRQVLTFLQSAPLPEPRGEKHFREKCLRDLQTARKGWLAKDRTVHLEEVAREAGSFARFADPQAILDAETRRILQLAGEVRRNGQESLAWLLEQRPSQGSPLLIVAVRFFFRRAVETDQALFQGLMQAQMGDSLEQMRRLEGSITAGFDQLDEALARHSECVTELLEDLAADIGRLLALAEKTHSRVEEVHSTTQATHSAIGQLQEQVRQLTEMLSLNNRVVSYRDSRSLRDPGNRTRARELLSEFRQLPPDRQRQESKLLAELGKLQHAAGASEEATHIFQEVASQASDVGGRAEAHFNAYQTALAARRYDDALTEFRASVELAPDRFALFPRKFEPVKILGAGGFGTAFLCQMRHSHGQVVVKTLRREDLDRDVSKVFAEAQVLEQLDHPVIIRPRDCDFVDDAETRAYLVMDYFPGQTLEEYVLRKGVLSAEELLPLAGLVAGGLKEAHAKGVLHRDVKPANLLVRREPTGWSVRLIDFGLAVKQQGQDAALTPSSSEGEVAGTFDYAAPEQLGKLPGVAVGPYSDVYGFGKLCCYALFRTSQPLRKHWRNIPESLADLLESCLEEDPAARPADFSAVLQRLDQVAKPTSAVPPPVAPARPGPVAPPRPDRASLLDQEIRNRVRAQDYGGALPLVRELGKLHPERDDVKRLLRQLEDRIVLRPPEQPVTLRHRVDPFHQVVVQRTAEGKVGVEARLVATPAISGARAGLALDASESMTKWYGIGSGKKVIGKPATKVENRMEPEVRKMAGYLARFSSDHAVSLLYWACGLKGHPPEEQIEEIGVLREDVIGNLKVTGPKQRTWGKETNLHPPLAHFAGTVFRQAPWSICIFLTDGKIDDLDKVKRYSRTLAEEIAAGRRSTIKLVLVGVGPEVEEAQMEDLDNMFEGSGLVDPEGREIDLWDHKIATQMQELEEIFDEVVAKYVRLGRSARVLDAQGRVVQEFPRGLPALLRFDMPAGSRSFTLEYDQRRVIQDLTEAFQGR